MCVTVTVRIPMLPEVIDANTATGQFVVERARSVDGRGAGTAVAPHGPNAIPACPGLVAVSSRCLTCARGPAEARARYSGSSAVTPWISHRE
jgi:hypothetical protein